MGKGVVSKENVSVCVCVCSVRAPDIFLCVHALVSKICEVTRQAVSHKRNIVDRNEVVSSTRSFPSHITLHHQQQPMGFHSMALM